MLQIFKLQSFFNFLICMSVMYIVTELIAHNNSIITWLYDLFIIIPIILIPCGIMYFLYLGIVTYIISIENKLLKYLLAIILGTFSLLSVLMYQWLRHYKNDTLIDFLCRPNYYLSFIVISIIQIDFSIFIKYSFRRRRSHP